MKWPWKIKKKKKEDLVLRISGGPLYSSRSFIDFMEHSQGVSEAKLVECLRAYPVPAKWTDADLTCLIRWSREDLNHEQSD